MKLTLLILFLSAIIVGSTAFFAVKYADGVVTEGHYEKGIDYDRDKKVLKDLGYNIKVEDIERNGNEVNVKYILNINDDKFLDKIKISVLRPAAKNDISDLKVKRNGKIYNLTFNADKKGYFLIRNSFEKDNLSIVYDKSIYVN